MQTSQLMEEANSTIGSLFSKMNDQMQKCIENCTKCAVICEHMTQHCLKKGGDHAEASHIKLLQDCADICATSARFMARDSEHHHLTCKICAEVCQACAQDCEKIADDEMMNKCVEICQECAQSCQEMAASR